MHRCSNCGFEADAPFRFCPECGLQQVEQSSDPLTGRTLGGRYRVLERIGEGSTGMVYRAEHISLKRPVAVKILHRDLQVNTETLSRFQREGMITSQFAHPNAIQIFDLDRDEDGLLFLAMELVEGSSLKALLQAEGALDTDGALSLMRQLLSVLDAAHGQGIIHRDLKPENLMIVGESDLRAMKVLDFGLSKLVDRPAGASLMTMTGHVMGTPLYMSPEQWQGQDTDHRTDLYSAGLVFYEMLSGEQAHSGSDLTEIFVQRTQHEPPLLRDLDGLDPSLHRFDHFFGIALARSKEERFQSASEMLEALDEADESTTKPSRKSTRVPSRSRTRARASNARSARRLPSNAESSGLAVDPRWIAAVGAAVVIAALWMSGLFDGSGGGPSEPQANEIRRAEASNRTRAIPLGERSEEDRAFLQRLDLAMASLRGGDLIAARREAGTATSLRRDAEALLVRGLVFRAEGDLESAQADLEDATELDPSYADAFAWLALVAIDRSQPAAMIAASKKALDADPDSDLAIAADAAVRIRAGDPEGALDDLENALGAPTHEGILRLWAGVALLELDRPGEAVTQLRDAVRLEPQEILGHLSLARAHLALDAPEQAEQRLRRVISRTEAIEPRVELARILLVSGSPSRALDALESVRSRLRSSEHLALLATTQFANDRRADATRTIERALAAGPAAPANLHRMAALIALEEDRFDDAAASAELAVEADDTVADHWSVLGLAEFRRDAVDDAVHAFEQAFRIDANDTFVSYTLGVLYMDYVDDAERALECFSAYQNAGGTDPKVNGFVQRLGG